LLGIPDIRDTECFRGLDRLVPEARKAAVASYRALYLDPAVEAWEHNAWWVPERAADASKEWTYLGFSDRRYPWALDLAAEAEGTRFWRWYGAWVLARVTGRVPLGAVSDHESPRELAACPSCGQPQASLAHLVSVCPGTLALWEEMAAAAGFRGARSDWEAARCALFDDTATPRQRAQHVILIGRIADGLAGHRAAGQQPPSSSGAESEASDSGQVEPPEGATA